MAEKIGKIIHEQRKKNKLTISELSSRLGIAVGTLANYENGKTLPRIDILSKIAEIFSLDYDDLYLMLVKEEKAREE